MAHTDSWMNDQIQYLEIIPDLYKSGVSTCFACPTDLFIDIIRINQLRAAEQLETNIHQLTTFSQDILNHVLQFSPLEWVATHLCGQNSETTTDIHAVEPIMSGWLS
ncbi:hypothetical protein ACLOAV_008716 [Pseudogymnoascus australis]